LQLFCAPARLRTLPHPIFAGLQILLASRKDDGSRGKYGAENGNAWRGAILDGAVLTYCCVQGLACMNLCGLRWVCYGWGVCLHSIQIAKSRKGSHAGKWRGISHNQASPGVAAITERIEASFCCICISLSASGLLREFTHEGHALIGGCCAHLEQIRNLA
jgi:hypothetical protein